MNEPDEFRCVHQAQEKLALYINSGRDINVIRLIHFDSIDRYDVWQCVFEKENEAYKELQEKELWNILFEDIEFLKTGQPTHLLAMLCVTLLSNISDFKQSPLSLDEAVNTVSDILGNDFLKQIRDEAQVFYERRVEIVKPYHRKDDEWVNNAKMVIDALDKEIKNGGKHD